MHRRRRAVVLLTLVWVLAAGGCTKLTPGSIDDFGAAKTVLVTLRDGETIKGRISVGAPVVFTTLGRTYHARVEDITAGSITLTRPYLQEQFERYHVQRERMQGGELHIEDGTGRILIPAYKIVKVEQVRFDRMKSARAAGFWGFTFFVVSKIMGARL